MRKEFTRKIFTGAIITLVTLLVIALLAMLLPTKAGASDPWYDELVPHVLGFEIPTGQYCVTDYRDGKPFTTCYCPCDGVVTIVEPVDTPTKEPQPTFEPTQVPPEPTKKPKCNCGAGNGGEGCNPNPNCDNKKKPDEK